MAKSKSSQPKAAAKVEEVNDHQPAETTAVETTNDESKSSQPKAAAEIDTPLVTTEVISSSATPVVEDPSLVKVLIKYPEDYPAKKRFFADGEIKAVSAEAAEDFIVRGFASKVE